MCLQLTSLCQRASVHDATPFVKCVSTEDMFTAGVAVLRNHKIRWCCVCSAAMASSISNAMDTGIASAVS